MSNCCDNKNPLQRSGTNQLQRLLPGLQPGYVLADEKDYTDWIFFANEFSKYLKYYDAVGSVNGNWNVFFSSDISAILGTIAVQNTETYRRSIKERFDYIRDDDNAADIVTVKQKLNELYSGIFALAQSLDVYIKKLPDKDVDEKNFVFKGNTINQVKTKLGPALKRLIAYYKAVDGIPAGSADFLEPSDMSGWKVLNSQVEAADIIINGTGLSSYWWSIPSADWAAYITAVAADESIFGPVAWAEYRRINHAVNHNLFSSIFDLFLQAYTKIVQEAENTLLVTLQSWEAHQAHYTLFLTFLKLFKSAQTGFNTITQRHLDFYYKDILQLKPKAAQPNHVHILAELAKQTTEYALKQNTEFKAGKDSEGKEVLYELDKETTFNKAKVALLKTLYKGDAAGKDDQLVSGTTTIAVNNKKRLFASPIANSDDGNGAKLKSANNEWHPFVNKKFKEGVLEDIAMPNAQVGFALASHYLFLSEGERRVTVRLATSNNLLLQGFTVDCYLTTEKGWYEVLGVPFTIYAIVDSVWMQCVQLSFLIPGDAPAITSYNSKVHGGTYNVDVPVFKAYLRNEDATAQYRYDDFKQLTVSKTEIKVDVGMEAAGYNQTGLKQLLLSNDFGPLDASKPFMPFGAQPKKDATFTIGNKEVFSKAGAVIKLNIEWGNLPASQEDISYLNTTYPYTYSSGVYSYSVSKSAPHYPNIRFMFLSGGVWQNKNDLGAAFSSTEIFNGVNPGVQVFTSGQKINNLAVIDYKESYEAYGSTSSDGFLKLLLNSDLGHKKYLSDLTTYLIEKPLGSWIYKKVGLEPTEPYTPTIQSIYLSYSASSIQSLDASSNFQNRSTRFFHLYPFGEAEQHAYLLNSTQIFLLPQFTHLNQSARVDHIGEFYIGIENLQALQSVNILFQVMEGSSNPLVAKPEEHVHWSFLSNNQWKDFNDQQVSDATRQLVQSGIISFIIPEEATTNNTMLPANHLWLRAAVSEAAEAVCKLISVDAQAAVVTFEPHDNAENFLDNALPAGTISKLKEPVSSVKKITQPYSSFGGRAKESNESFYVRVSERLRHKSRAITIWDYEHLVLEAFPSIHKVKCLNHTKFDIDKISGEMEYNEVLPGYVTVITIPDLQNRNDTNPLRPYTNQNTLLEIEEYLRQKISCHVNLKVKNPRFEEVWLTFNLKLIKGFDDFAFYKTQLQQEITQFLTPWAYNNGIDIQFGGKIYKSVLIDFIEERPYVDYILDVKMYHNTNPDNEDAGDCVVTIIPPGATGKLEVVEASTARSILVSTPASKHVITQVIEQDAEEITDCPVSTNNPATDFT
jgi:hypothetical protein